MDFTHHSERHSELTKRVVTASIGAVLFVSLIIWGGWFGICFLTTLLSLAMIHEFAGMSFKLPDHVEKRYLLLLLTWFIGLVNLLSRGYEFELLVACFLGLSCYFLFTAKRYGDGDYQSHYRELEYAVFGMLYLVFLPLFLTRIYDRLSGRDWTLVFFLVVWAGDIGAYFVGKKYGKKKLYPEVSPKKSVEGAYGGLASGLAVAAAYKVLFFPGMSWGAVLFVSFFVGAVSQIGDLCESYLKRVYGTKDSGSILPGHGGFLDRFDGVVFSLPVMYACVRIFG